MALENQRYGRNKDTIVNKTYIESGDYRRKFDNITDNSEVNRALYNKSKEMLRHRSGTLLEDMYWLDGGTGKVIASALNEQSNSAVAYSPAIKKAIKNRNDLIAIHTHPHSMPPSAADFNSCCRNQYKCGYVACHNGKVFGYTSNEIVDERLYNAYIKRFANEGYSEYDAQIETLKKIKENASIDFWEVE